MNIFVSIDRSWSYRFFEFNKRELSEVNFFEFSEELFSSIATWITAMHNFNYGLTGPEFNKVLSDAMEYLKFYPKLASKIQELIRAIHVEVRPCMGAIQGPIATTTAISDDTGNLIGLVCQTVN